MARIETYSVDSLHGSVLHMWPAAELSCEVSRVFLAGARRENGKYCIVTEGRP